MGFRRRLHRLLGRAGTPRADADAREAEETAEDEGGQAVKSVALPGDADWEEAAALVVAEDGTKHRFPLPDEVGVFSKRVEQVDLDRVEDVVIEQSSWQPWVQTGTIRFATAGGDAVDFAFVEHPHDLYLRVVEHTESRAQ